MFERLGGGVQTFAVLSFTMDGIPLIYNGQEAGLDKRLEFFERDPIEWKSSPLTPFYRTLTELKRTSPALGTEAPTTRIPSTADEQVYSFIRGEAGGPEVLVIANLKARDVLFFLGSERIAGAWTDAFSGQTVELDDSQSFELRSWDYKVLYR